LNFSSSLVDKCRGVFTLSFYTSSSFHATALPLDSLGSEPIQRGARFTSLPPLGVKYSFCMKKEEILEKAVKMIRSSLSDDYEIVLFCS